MNAITPGNVGVGGTALGVTIGGGAISGAGSGALDSTGHVDAIAIGNGASAVHVHRRGNARRRQRCGRKRVRYTCNSVRRSPNGLAIMISAPLAGGRCGGGLIQIYPTSNSCSAVQAALIKQGKTLGALQKLPLVETGEGVRNILMPGAGGGCTVVSVRQN